MKVKGVDLGNWLDRLGELGFRQMRRLRMVSNREIRIDLLN